MTMTSESCPKRSLVGQLLDEELMDRNERDALRGHVAACAECRGELAHLQSIQESLRGLPRRELPREVLEKVYELTSGEVALRATRAGRKARPLQGAAGREDRPLQGAAGCEDRPLQGAAGCEDRPAQSDVRPIGLQGGPSTRGAERGRYWVLAAAAVLAVAVVTGVLVNKSNQERELEQAAAEARQVLLVTAGALETGRRAVMLNVREEVVPAIQKGEQK